jgi:hypothetical protein
MPGYLERRVTSAANARAAESRRNPYTSATSARLLKAATFASEGSPAGRGFSGCPKI